MEKERRLNERLNIHGVIRATGVMLAVVYLAGCTSNVRVDEQFPDVIAQPLDLSAALVVDDSFRQYVAKPDEKTEIAIGEAQVEILTKAFSGLFSSVTVVPSGSQAPAGTDMLITPSVLQVQVSTPTDSYLNVYEVWIKYSLALESGDGAPIDSWFLPAYGKTPHSYLLSRTRAIDEATVVALRDAGAKLILDFYRIPAVYGWMQQRQKALEAGS